MIITTPEKLAIDLLDRSICSVQVAAVLEDSHERIFAWGHNYASGNCGIHAETHCISRANPKRLKGSSIYVAGRRVRTGRFVGSRPCAACYPLLVNLGIEHIYYTNKNGGWDHEKILV